MGLSNTYVQPTNRIPDLFNKIRDGQAPERFTQQLLKDWGFKSTADRTFISMLKALGFLTSDGKPTQRYNDYRDHSRSRAVMADALRETYADLFLIKQHPTAADKEAIEGKFKSFHNVSENVARLMTKTFMSLLTMADLKGSHSPSRLPEATATSPDSNEADVTAVRHAVTGLHYNIQIHLPATKDVEVYNAIFKSLREHLLIQ